MSREAIDYRVRVKRWRVVLPDVYFFGMGELSRRQMMIAAQLSPDGRRRSTAPIRAHETDLLRYAARQWPWLLRRGV